MATKKRKEQLESLLDWEREGDRLPKTVNLFNRKISKDLYLYEIKEKVWNIALVKENTDKTGLIINQSTILKHETLIQLGLSILDAIKQTEDRFIKGD